MNRNFSSGLPCSRGFTLVELMIAMLLGLIVIAGVSSVFLANLRSYKTNTALSDVQSNARIAYELMARDIRQAGLTGCNSRSTRIANVLNNGPYGPDGGAATSDNWWANLGRAVYGYDGDQDDPAVTTGSAVKDRVDGTDSLELIGAIGMGLSVEEDKEPAANFKLNEKTSNLATGDIIMVCDPDHAVITQISSYNDANVTVGHDTGSKNLPGNCSKGLGYPTECTTNGNSYTFGRNSSISKLGANDWYIGVNPVGGKSLYRISLVGSTTQAAEMVRGVTNMQVLYHVNGLANYEDATAVAGNWNAVDAVRVTLTLESNDKRAGTDGKAVQPIVRTFTTTTTIRNRVI